MDSGVFCGAPEIEVPSNNGPGSQKTLRYISNCLFNLASFAIFLPTVFLCPTSSKYVLPKPSWPGNGEELIPKVEEDSSQDRIRCWESAKAKRSECELGHACAEASSCGVHKRSKGPPEPHCIQSLATWVAVTSSEIHMHPHCVRTTPFSSCQLPSAEQFIMCWALTVLPVFQLIPITA